MTPQITMRELIILVLCFVLYVVAVEVYEARTELSHQGQIIPLEQTYNYLPDSSTLPEDNSGKVTPADRD